MLTAEEVIQKGEGKKEGEFFKIEKPVFVRCIKEVSHGKVCLTRGQFFTVNLVGGQESEHRNKLHFKGIYFWWNASCFKIV